MTIIPNKPSKHNLGWIYAIAKGSTTWKQWLTMHPTLKPDDKFSYESFKKAPQTTQWIAILYYLTQASPEEMSCVFINSDKSSLLRECYQYYQGCLTYPEGIQTELTKKQPFLQFLTFIKAHNMGAPTPTSFFNTEPYTLLWLSQSNNLELRQKAITHMKRRNKIAEYIYVLDDLSAQYDINASFNTSLQELIEQFWNGTLHDQAFEFIQTHEEQLLQHASVDATLFQGPTYGAFRYGLQLLHKKHPDDAMHIFHTKMLTFKMIERTPLELWFDFGVDLLMDSSLQKMETLRRRLFGQMHTLSKHAHGHEFYLTLLHRMATQYPSEFETAYRLTISQDNAFSQQLLLAYHCKYALVSASELPPISSIKPKELVNCLSAEQRKQWKDYLLLMGSDKPTINDFLSFYPTLQPSEVQEMTTLYLH